MSLPNLREVQVEHQHKSERESQFPNGKPNWDWKIRTNNEKCGRILKFDYMCATSTVEVPDAARRVWRAAVRHFKVCTTTDDTIRRELVYTIIRPELKSPNLHSLPVTVLLLGSTFLVLLFSFTFQFYFPVLFFSSGRARAFLQLLNTLDRESMCSTHCLQSTKCSIWLVCITCNAYAFKTRIIVQNQKESVWLRIVRGGSSAL